MEAQRLHEAGVQIIVALGHSGFEKDREVAALVPHVDIVVGGHSDTFLYSGDDVGESRRKPENGHHHKGDYPAVVKQEGSGRTVLVVQAYANTKYLGHLTVRFDKEGEVSGWSGGPTLLDQRVVQDPAVAAEVASMRAEIDKFSLEVVGRLEETLHHSREAESSMGNLVADVAAWSWSNLTSPPVQLAMINSGSMRPKSAGASLKEGEVTLKDLLTSLPYQNSFNMVSLRGAGLKKALEHNVELCGLDPAEGCDGRFLQLSSGFRVVYDLTQPAGSRLVSARVRISEEVRSGLGSISEGEELQEEEGDKSEEFQEVEDNTAYQVVTTDYL